MQLRNQRDCSACVSNSMFSNKNTHTSFLPSFAFGASCTGWGISVLYYLTHWEALRIAWKKHPDFFEVFCAVIAGLVWLISVFFTLIAMSYVGFTIACTFFHSWMLIYSAWNILLFTIHSTFNIPRTFTQMRCLHDKICSSILFSMTTGAL